MNIAGVVKDWLLIGLSVALFHSAVSGLNLFGYLIAFLGVCWYNYRKLQNMKRRQAGLAGVSKLSAPPPPLSSWKSIGNQGTSCFRQARVAFPVSGS